MILDTTASYSALKYEYRLYLENKANGILNFQNI
jgi:hypothetical protein